MFRTHMHDERGFSLIELLIAMTVMGIIMAALATGFITTMKGTQGAHERLVESHDAQLLASYFPSDVQSADEALTNLATWNAAATPADCAGAPASGSDNKMLLRWTELINGSSLRAFSVSYRLEQSKLVRYQCTGTASFATPLPLTAAQRSAALQSALAGVTATSDVVAHDLSPSQASPTLSVRQVSWSLMSSPKPGVVSSQYTFNLSASMRKLGTVAAAPPAGSFVVAMPASVTAGVPFTATITLTGFSGQKNLTWSGAGSAPNGTAGPSYPPNPVTFDGSGQATVTMTLVKAETTTLSVSDGTITGSSTAFTVNGGAPVSLAFTNCAANGGAAGSCTPNVAVGGNNKYMDGFVSVFDTYGNAAGIDATTSWSVVVTSSDPGNWSISNSPVTLAGPATQSATTFRVTHTSNGNTSATLTASTTGSPALAAGSMTVSKN